MTMNYGSENLDIMECAPRYLKHVARLIDMNLPRSGHIVDFGAGNGIQTLLVRKPSASILCIESDERRLADLQLLGYRTAKSLSGVEDGSVDAVFSSNCLEHIDDDFAVVSEISRVLKDNGVVVLYVPAFPFLFSEMDKSVGHVRRYTRRRLQDLAGACGFQETSIRYVDSLGVLATLLFKISKKSGGKPSKWSVLAYDSLIFALSRVIDAIVHDFFGKNLLMVATKSQLVHHHVP